MQFGSSVSPDGHPASSSLPSLFVVLHVFVPSACSVWTPVAVVPSLFFTSYAVYVFPFSSFEEGPHRTSELWLGLLESAEASGFSACFSPSGCSGCSGFAAPPSPAAATPVPGSFFASPPAGWVPPLAPSGLPLGFGLPDDGFVPPGHAGRVSPGFTGSAPFTSSCTATTVSVSAWITDATTPTTFPSVSK